MKAIEYTCYSVKMFRNDRTNAYLGSIYGADLSQSQAVSVAGCLNQMFSEQCWNVYAEIEQIED